MHALNIVRDQRTSVEQQRSAAIDAMEAVATTALDQNRSLTPADDREITALRSTIAERDEHLEVLDGRETELVELERDTELRAARPSLRTLSPSDPWDATGDTRSRAVGAVEASEVVPDATRSRLVDAIEAGDDQSTPLAEWALATSSPDYLRAFHKLILDPATAHVRMTDAESAAFARVGEVQRAMSLTDSAGGYMVPFTLDPSVLLSGDGTQDTMRDIARVVTIATTSGMASARPV